MTGCLGNGKNMICVLRTALTFFNSVCHFHGLARNSAAKLTEGNKEAPQTHWKNPGKNEISAIFDLGSKAAWLK